MSTELVDQAWYERFYGDSRDSDLAVPPAIIRRYEQARHRMLFPLETLHHCVGDVRDKTCLYLGCGAETSTVLFALKGAKVWALDLAVEALRRQKLMAVANGTDARTHAVVSSCDALPFRDESFDVVIGIGILHHLQHDLDTPCAEVARVLRRDGRAVFSEPITRSRVLQRVRGWLPISRPRDASPQCRPLAAAALDHFGRHFLVNVHAFGFLSRLSRFVLPGQPLEFAPGWKRGVVYLIHALDSVLLRLPGLARLGGVVILNFEHADAPPRRDEELLCDRG